jgi:two-component system, cell cycle sensor histidine kinase and response regulator CckA
VVKLAPRLGNVRADRGQMEQVLMNLAVNARDAMPRGGTLTMETRDVTLTAEDSRHAPFLAAGGYVAVLVTDTGSGMDEATRKRIFEPFFTTKERGKGTGLGLATVYGIVKQSGGYILVESVPGNGSTFAVYLPRVEKTEGASAESRAPAPSGRGTETILLVEDEAALRALVQPALEGRGYRVLAAASGAEALRVMEDEPSRVELLLTDVVLPSMSGPELVAAVSQRFGAGVKVLYMSGYTDDAIVQHGVLAPGTQLIGKPFTLDALAGRVRQVLDTPS